MIVYFYCRNNICAYIFVRIKKCISIYERSLEYDQFIPDLDRIPEYSVFFLTDTCIGIIKSSGVMKFVPNN